MMERMEPWLEQQDSEWRERNWEFLKACVDLLGVTKALGLDVVLIDTELKRGVFRLLQSDGTKSELFALGTDTIMTVTKTLQFQHKLQEQARVEHMEAENQDLTERVARLEAQMKKIAGIASGSHSLDTADNTDSWPVNKSGTTITNAETEMEADNRERLDELIQRASILGDILSFPEEDDDGSQDKSCRTHGEIHYRRPSKINGPFRVHNALIKNWRKARFGSPRPFVFYFPEELRMAERFIAHDEKIYERWYNDH